MRLISIGFTEWKGTQQEWCLEKMSFGQLMLIVGKNTAGKSRSLAITASLAQNITGNKALGLTGDYVAIFDYDGKSYQYELSYQNMEVTHERIIIDGVQKMIRGNGGAGEIIAEQIDSATPMKFQVPPTILAAVARRDEIQHSFIEPLFNWANSLRYYQFGATPQGLLTIFMPLGQPVDDRDQNAVMGIFRDGERLYGSKFIDSIKSDLAEIDYPVNNIELASPVSIRFHPEGPQPVSINVREKGLLGVTDQIMMSTGMFRVLALLVHVNFAQFKGSASSVLIDDIGEGLDFDRSCKLIKLLREKAEKFDFQLVMSTNDKFVMNHVPLSEWTVLHRTGSLVHVRNYENSKAAFDDFRFTGLSNFSFFEMNAVEMGFNGSSEWESA
jgi:energy-coupling factor transporter ATP-binding protein EcfA2